MNRRGFLLGLAAGIAAPTIVKASSLMPVKTIIHDWLPCDGRVFNPKHYPELAAWLKRELWPYGTGRLPNTIGSIIQTGGFSNKVETMPLLLGSISMATRNIGSIPLGMLILR